jgi:hypothetical protein
MIEWLLSFWYRRCRKLDMQILWPSCVRLAPDLDRAKAAFAVHALNDKAWLVLGEDQVISFIHAYPVEAHRS